MSLKKQEDQVISMLNFHLIWVHNRMNQFVDSHRSHREFKIGYFVYLKLHPYKQHSLKNRKTPHKLSPLFYCPFCVTYKVGAVDYKLSLPHEASIHEVFHVSQLKLSPNPPSDASALPQFWLDIGNSKEPGAHLLKDDGQAS